MAEGSDGAYFYPAHLWGLDYHFNTYNKMYVRDILTMEPYPSYPEAFCYQNHPIYKVDIMGTVVKKSENSKCCLYAVDDGTGVILACCWKESICKLSVGKSTVTYLPDCLKEKLSKLQRDVVRTSEGYMLGDLVNMKGKIKIFREKKEVVANQHSRVDNPSIQVMRMLELPKVYSLYYDKPFKPPNKVLQSLYIQQQINDSGVKPEISLASELKNIMHECLSNNSSNRCEFMPYDILQFASVKKFMADHQIKSDTEDKETQLVLHAFALLEEDSLIIKRGDRRNLYEFLCDGSKLNQCILKILQTVTALPQCSERGCNYMHVTDELHKTLQYSRVRRDAVLNCLQKLEAQSDVIRSTHAHFLPCSL